MDYKKDYYSILGVTEKATPEELRASYRRLAKRYHPDKNPGNPEAEEHFKRINEAYEILGNRLSRNIYDHYRTGHQTEAPPQEPVHAGEATGHHNPHKATKTRTYTVTREKRIYIQGVMEAKFQGIPDLAESYTLQWENRFTITPTEILVTIPSEGIYTAEAPEEYRQGYAGADLFTMPVRQPVHCTIITAGREAHYQLDLYDIRIKDPVLDGITRHEQYSFGTLRGALFAYILHRYEEVITETYTACAGATGRVETKTENGQVFTREERYAADCNTYWTEWRRVPQKQPYHAYSEKTTPAYPSYLHPQDSGWGGLLILLLPCIIWPPLLWILLALAGVLLLPLLLVWLTEKAGKGFRWVLAFLLGGLFLLSIGAMLQPPARRTSPVTHTRLDSIGSKKEVIKHPDMPADTLITHLLRWQDRDDSLYTIQLSVSSSELHRSAMAHRQMDSQQFVSQGIGGIYTHMLATNNDAVKPAATAFSNLAKAKKLNRQQTASMIVSCVQSVPYALIVDRSCAARYNDAYINSYLAACKTDCCKGYSKFGVQSPVEFLGDLKGDCDTRALFLYSILGQLGYSVALMTSNYYRHALIAVALDGPFPNNAIAVHAAGKRYYLWETTSKKFGPGALPAALSDMDHWNITLIQ